MSTFEKIRYLSAIALFAIISGIIYFRGRKADKKPLSSAYLKAAVICFVFLAVISQIYIENLFISFSTPQQVLEYTNGDTPIFTVEGESSCLLVVDKSATKTLTSVAKRDKSGSGWKIANDFFALKHIYMNIVNGCAINIFRFKSTDDYYVVTTIPENSSEFTGDNCNLEFIALEKESSPLYYAYVHNLDMDEYGIILDGHECPLVN